MKPITQYEEILQALEKVDEILAQKEDGPVEFEDTGNPEKPFRTEYAHEGCTEKKTRYRRRNSDG